MTDNLDLLSSSDNFDFGSQPVDYYGTDSISTDRGLDLSSMAYGLKAAGLIGQSYGTRMMGKETKSADDYNASLVREQEAIAELQLGKQEVSTLSTQRAMYAKAGVTMSGSPLDTAVSTASGYELDKQIAKYNYESKANMLEYEGKVADANARAQANIQIAQGIGQMAMMFA